MWADHNHPQPSMTIYNHFQHGETWVNHTESVSTSCDWATNPTAWDPGSHGMATLPAWLTADAKLVYARQLRWIRYIPVNVVQWHAIYAMTLGDGLKMFETCTSAVCHCQRSETCWRWGFQIIWQGNGCGCQTHLCVKEDCHSICSRALWRTFSSHQQRHELVWGFLMLWALWTAAIAIVIGKLLSACARYLLSLPVMAPGPQKVLWFESIRLRSGSKA